MGRRNLIKSLQRGAQVTHMSTQKQTPIVTLGGGQIRRGEMREKMRQNEGGEERSQLTELWTHSVNAWTGC